MEDLEYEKQKLVKTIDELGYIKNGEEEILKTLPSKYRSNPVLLENLMSSTATKIANINRIKEKPYLARIDFKEDSRKYKDKLYIGKIGVIDLDGKVVVTDWRAPVASLYYDSNLGKVGYNAPQGRINGNLTLKRQIIINKGEVKEIFDVDSVSDDELLKPYLGANADSRLKNIVASIQSEQNSIIRESIEKDIIVQGVAGSGKTTVALHRIAYLMYNNADKYKPNQFMVIGPNKFFINYISNVLPDLDAGNAIQLTFEELASNYTVEKLKFEDSTKKLNDIINGNKENSDLKFKSSLNYMKLLEKYLNNLEKRLILDTGLVLNDILILSKDEILDVYNQIQGECVAQKLEMTAKVIANRIKNDENIYNRIKTLMFEKEKEQTTIEMKKKVAKKEIAMLKELTTNGFEKDIKKFLSISNVKVLNIYKEFIKTTDDQKIKEYTLKSLEKNIIENEDIAPLMYIKLYLFGNEEYKRIKSVVIDEAQDFGVFGFYILRKLFPNAHFSIFGDMAQGIYAYRAITNWNEVIENVLPDANLLNLKKSYRTSTEIMNEANKISHAINLGMAQPVIRSAGPVIKSNINSNKEEYIANQVKKYLNDGFKSIAIIYKNQENMAKLHKTLKSNNIESEIIYKDQEKYDGGVCILTSYLSKGLEFDVVIIADADDSIYNSDSLLDMKLLYVAMTRALHKLEIIYTNNICKYLE